jgi:regulatory protein
VARARSTALEDATKALARRDRSAADLTAYLERRGAAADEASVAVGRLRDAGYVDDARYAAARAATLAARGYGDEAIRFELVGAGVGEDDVDAALATLEPEHERAASLLAAAKQPQAMLRRLTAKGFSAESLEPALAALNDAPE